MFCYVDSWHGCYTVTLGQRGCLKIQIFPHGGTQHDTGQEARAPPAGEVALMQLCCVSDWPLHALSWQQSEGGSPGLPVPFNQKASAAPLYRTNTKFDSLALASHLHPAKTSLWPLPPFGYPHRKTGSSIFLFFVTFVCSNHTRHPPFISFLLAWILIPGENVGCLFYPLLYFAFLSHLSPPNKHLYRPPLPKLSLPFLISLQAGPWAHLWGCKTAPPPHPTLTLIWRNQNRGTAGAL